ncbi:MAG: archaeosortase/exosortase family protein [Candidatus Poribacteria bacterium]|nr:archaeosortase/exosortase family protein [Candidatus Poribacteria bacterium]
MSLIALQVVAFWRVWVWYVNRVWESPEDLLGLILLVTVSALLWTQPKVSRESHIPLMPVILLICLYILFYPFAPPLIRAAIAITALGTTLYLLYFGRMPPLSVWGLFLLALPVIPTMQFYLGYPARIIAITLTVPILQSGGFAVGQEGTALLWDGQMIQFDAPCSGVKMLWAGLFVTLALASYSRLGLFALIVLLAICITAILLGNVLRGSSLFYMEAGILDVPSWWHHCIGLVAFACTAGAVAYGTQWIRGWEVERRKGSMEEAKRGRWGQFYWSNRFMGIRIVFVGLCTVAAFMPMIIATPHKYHDLTQFPGWPETFRNQPIQQLSLSDRESTFGKDFPGMLGRFTDGKREIVIRWVTQATRKLHPASDCFRGLGYVVEPAPMHIDSDGLHWGCFKARHKDQTLRVCEQIIDADGKIWSDVSAWYWAAFLGRSTGPWWAYTVAEKIE